MNRREFFKKVSITGMLAGLGLLNVPSAISEEIEPEDEDFTPGFDFTGLDTNIDITMYPTDAVMSGMSDKVLISRLMVRK